MLTFDQNINTSYGKYNLDPFIIMNTISTCIVKYLVNTYIHTYIYIYIYICVCVCVCVQTTYQVSVSIHTLKYLVSVYSIHIVTNSTAKYLSKHLFNLGLCYQVFRVSAYKVINHRLGYKNLLSVVKSFG